MYKVHPLSSPMVVCSLDMKKHLFRFCENGDELLDLEIPYLNIVGVLLCILLIVLTHILIFQLIYLPGTIPFKPKDIGMISNIYYTTSKEQLI